MDTYVEQMSQFLRPAAPPRVLESVYTDDQYERLLGIVKAGGPWPTIASHHFDTVDELIATTTGVVPKDHGLTLDDIASPQFRGFYGQNSVCFYPELHDCFYNERVHRNRQGLLGRAVREAHDDAVQHLRSRPVDLSAAAAPRRSHLPWRALRERAGVAHELHGQVGSVHRPPGEDGADHHLVVPRRERHVHVLARRPARCPQGARAPALEQGRRRAERADVPPRRSGRRVRLPAHPQPEASLDDGFRRRRPTSGSSAPTTCASTRTVLETSASSSTGAPRSTPT